MQRKGSEARTLARPSRPRSLLGRWTCCSSDTRRYGENLHRSLPGRRSQKDLAEVGNDTRNYTTPVKSRSNHPRRAVPKCKLARGTKGGSCGLQDKPTWPSTCWQMLRDTKPEALTDDDHANLLKEKPSARSQKRDSSLHVLAYEGQLCTKDLAELQRPMHLTTVVRSNFRSVDSRYSPSNRLAPLPASSKSLTLVGTCSRLMGTSSGLRKGLAGVVDWTLLLRTCIRHLMFPRSCKFRARARQGSHGLFRQDLRPKLVAFSAEADARISDPL